MLEHSSRRGRVRPVPTGARGADEFQVRERVCVQEVVQSAADDERFAIRRHGHAVRRIGAFRDGRLPRRQVRVLNPLDLLARREIHDGEAGETGQLNEDDESLVTGPVQGDLKVRERPKHQSDDRHGGRGIERACSDQAVLFGA
jgi:hypothetical protein